MTRANHLAVAPLGPTIGAIVSGVDLRDDHGDTVIEDIRAALLAHKVLFFEGQDLTPAQQRDFAARFGDLHVHPLYPGEAGVPDLPHRRVMTRATIFGDKPYFRKAA